MKQLFKSMTVYHLNIKDNTVLNALGNIEDKIKEHIFTPPLPSEEGSIGFEKLVENYHLNLQGHIFFKIRAERKLLPSSVVNEYVNIKASELEQEQGFKPGKKQRMELKEVVIAELLPKAFIVGKEDFVWIDTKNNKLIINNTSGSKTDEIIGLLIKTFGDLGINIVKTKLSPVAFMTNVIAQKLDLPDTFIIADDFELKEDIEAGSTIKYKRYSIDNEDVLNHINNGKSCVQLSLVWEDKVVFSLNDVMQIKQIKYTDLVEMDKSDENDFEASLTLESMTLSKLIEDLIKGCLDGQVDYSSDDDDSGFD